MITIDGKTLGGSYSRDDRQAIIHIVNAFVCADQVVLGQLKTDEKSNEITAIPELLDLLDVTGTLVSIHAMGCQTGITQTIVDKGGDYLLTLKGNQADLFEAVKAAFKDIRQAPLGPIQIEGSRGRVKARLDESTLSRGGVKSRFERHV